MIYEHVLPLLIYLWMVRYTHLPHRSYRCCRYTKPLDVRVKITPDDEYAPASVRFDASISKIQKWNIRKFLYDFGDGHKYEWEGVVTTYKYNKPGEYKITVTAVSTRVSEHLKPILSFSKSLKKTSTYSQVLLQILPKPVFLSFNAQIKVMMQRYSGISVMDLA